jgi:site-specific recombinase XerD
MSTALPVTVIEPSEIAVAGFLARYRQPTRSAYSRDLLCFWQRCADHQLPPLAVRRPHLELYLRDLEARGYAPATVSRRLSTVAGMFRYAVIDELVTADPTMAVTRPRVPWEGQHRTVLHPLEFSVPPGSTAAGSGR